VTNLCHKHAIIAIALSDVRRVMEFSQFQIRTEFATDVRWCPRNPEDDVIMMARPPLMPNVEDVCFSNL
jgi:hypothetical protein